jgi:pimeloyl-ACP methyl ester carboxylesterase
VTASVTRTEPINVAVQGEGRPVLVLHGLGGDSKQSLGLFPVGSPVTLIAPELPGHGDTDLLPDDPATFDAFAELCASVLDGMLITGRISTGPLPVVGVSMGAGVALALVAARPDLVAGLTLIRPSWLDEAPPPNLAPFPIVAGLLRELGPAAGAAAFRDTAIYRNIEREAPAMAQSLLGQFSRPHASERARVLKEMPLSLPLPDRQAYTALAVPTLVVGAPEDPVHPYALAQTLSEWVPGSRFASVPRKLLDPSEHNQAVARVVSNELARLGWM